LEGFLALGCGLLRGPEQLQHRGVAGIYTGEVQVQFRLAAKMLTKGIAKRAGRRDIERSRNFYNACRIIGGE
jgi:hypothetical protein